MAKFIPIFWAVTIFCATTVAAAAGSLKGADQDIEIGAVLSEPTASAGPQSLAAETSGKKRKKKGKAGKPNKKKKQKKVEDAQGDSSAAADQSAAPSDESATPDSSPTGGGENQGAYVSGSVPIFLEFDRYPLSVLKSAKGGVRVGGAFKSESDKTTVNSSDSGSSGSSTFFLLNADYLHKIGTIGIVPSFWLVSGSNSFEYTTIGASGQPEQKKSTNSTTIMTPGAGLAMAVTPLIDLGLNLDYLIGSRKSEDSTASYSILSFDLGVGAHAKLFEFGFTYRPGSKYKSKVTSDAGDSEDESEYPTRMALMGRYKITGTIFAGLQYESESVKDYSDSIIDFEGGMTSGGMQYGAALGLIDKKIGDTKESGFRLLGHFLLGSPEKQTFGVSAGFQSTSSSSEFSKTTGTGFQVSASANFAF